MKKFATLLITVLLFTACSKKPTENIPPQQNSDTNTETNQIPQETTADIYFIKLDDGGKDGDLIGCNDSIVAVPMPVDSDSLENALTRLFTYNGQYHVPTGYYHALYNSTLQLERTENENNLTKIYLTGDYQFSGVCDTPRYENQLLYTAKKYTGDSKVEFFINNEPLSDLLKEDQGAEDSENSQ